MIGISKPIMSRYIWQDPKWPQWKWSEPALKDLLQAVQRKRDYLAGLAAGRDAEHGNRVIAELSTQETVATSAIEGVKLDPDLVRSSIMRRLGLGVSKERAERIGAAAKGVIDVLADSTQNLKPLTLERLFSWHTAIKGDLDITEWVRWSAACVDAAYDDARLCIERVGQVARFWTRHRDVPFNARQRRVLEVALSPSDAEESWLTGRRIVKLTNAAAVTASRDLAQLEEWGVIRKDPKAGGRSTRYSVVLEEPKAPQLLRN